MPTEGAEFIKAHDVIKMSVGVEDRVDLAQIFAQGLFTEVGAGVDEDGDLRSLQVKRAPRAHVPGITRGAHRAVATNNGHADGGAGAEKGGSGMEVRVQISNCRNG